MNEPLKIGDYFKRKDGIRMQVTAVNNHPVYTLVCRVSEVCGSGSYDYTSSGLHDVNHPSEYDLVERIDNPEETLLNEFTRWCSVNYSDCGIRFMEELVPQFL